MIKNEIQMLIKCPEWRDREMQVNPGRESEPLCKIDYKLHTHVPVVCVHAAGKYTIQHIDIVLKIAWLSLLPHPNPLDW